MPYQVHTVDAMRRQGRSMRRPQHRFLIKAEPYKIQPFLIAPVLAGETMRSFVMQARAVSDPLTNPLTGWWLEYYFFYVKLRDLDGRDDFTAMVLDPEKDMSSYEEAADDDYFHCGDGPNWTRLCTKRVTEEYFRNEGETWDTWAIDSVPLASVVGESWIQSAHAVDDQTGFDIDVDLDADTNIMASEIQEAMSKYNLEANFDLTDKSFDDYLMEHGIRKRLATESHTPELLRYVRQWTYPTNTVDVSDGSVSTAVSWAVKERADKDRFFPEPGFILGVTVSRPKVYFKNIGGNCASMMNDAMSWLPQMLSGNPELGMKTLAQGSGVLQNFADADGYRIDVKDLLHYGDEFRNFANTATDANIVDLPSTTLDKRYPSATDIAGLFTTTDVDKIRQDGVVQFQIASRLHETTPER